MFFFSFYNTFSYTFVLLYAISFSGVQTISKTHI